MSRITIPILLLFLAFRITRVSSLSAISGSPCYVVCKGDQAATSGDIVCTDDDFVNTDKGKTLSSCMTCLQTSSYQSGWMTDPILFLYYLSTVQQTCLSGKPAEPISDCSNKCGNISSAFSNVGGRNFFQSPYTYCTANGDTYENAASGCATCLQSQDGTVVLGNFVHVGKVGCDTQPDVQSGASISLAGDLFDATTLNSSSSGGATNTSATSRPSSSSSSNNTATPALATSTVAVTSTNSASALVSTAATSTVTASSSNSDEQNDNDNDNDNDETNGGIGGLSRGAAAGIGIAVGLIGIAAIIFLAIVARKRVLKKQQGAGDGAGARIGAGPWMRMQDSPQMKQVSEKEILRGATPPAAGVFVLPSAVPPAVPAAVAAKPKKSKSFKSVASKSLKSLRMTPRTSEWYNAANPKHSEDLSALPQKGWD